MSPTQPGGYFVAIDNPRFDYAETFATFTRLAESFYGEIAAASAEESSR
jgi:hypothetical protein